MAAAITLCIDTQMITLGMKMNKPMIFFFLLYFFKNGVAYGYVVVV